MQMILASWIENPHSLRRNLAVGVVSKEGGGEMGVWGVE